MSEVIKCDFCGSTNLRHKGAERDTMDMGLTLFKCNNCEIIFWYNTGNSKMIVNIES